MKKSNKLTYAQVAKRIIQKYDKRLGDGKYDKLALDAMNHELDALAERQEMAKQAQAENQYREMCKGGKLPKMAIGGTFDGFEWPGIPIDQSKHGLPPYSPEVYDYNKGQMKGTYVMPLYPSITGKNFDYSYIDNWEVARDLNPYLYAVTRPNARVTQGDFNKDNIIDKMPTKQAQVNFPNLTFQQNAVNSPSIPGSKKFNTPASPANAPNSPSWWSQIPTESKIGMGAQLAGVLGQGIIAATAGKPKNLEYQDITIPEPELIRNDEQLAAATRAYRGAQNNLRYLSPSQYMSAMSDLATRESAAKAGIIEGTANQNAEILNRSRWQQYAAQRDNAANRLSVDQYNEAMRQNYIGNIGQMVGNIAGVAAGTMKDESARKMQNSMMGFMSQANYGSVVGKNGYPIATKRVGNTETWEDIDGPHYRVNGQEVGLNEFIAAFEKHQKSLQTNTEKK